MSRTTRQQKIEIIRSETREQANTRQRVADILTDINEVTIDDIIAGDNIEIDKTNPSKPVIKGKNTPTLDEVTKQGNYSSVPITFTTGVDALDGEFGLEPNTWSLYAGGINKSITGEYNTSFGIDCLRLATTATFNTVFGSFALPKITIGRRNSFFGYYSGFSVTTSSHNTSFGTSSLQTLTTGNSNIAIGDNSLPNQKTKNNTIGIGKDTGAGGESNHSLYIGSRAGSGNNIDGTLAIHNWSLRQENADNVGTYPSYTDSQMAAPNSLIYGNFINRFLKVNGKFSVNPAYIPSADSTFTKHIVAKPDGTFGWEDKPDDAAAISFATQPEMESQTPPDTENNKAVSLFGLWKWVKKLNYLYLNITTANSVLNKIWYDGLNAWVTNKDGVNKQLAYDENGVNIPQGRITTTTSITTETKTNSNLSQNGKNVIIDNGANNINLRVNAFAGGNFCATYIKDGTGTITIVAGSDVTLDLVQYTEIVNGKSGSRFMISQNGSTNTFKIFVRNYEIDSITPIKIVNLPFQNNFIDSGEMGMTFVAGTSYNPPSFEPSGRKPGEYCIVFNDRQSIKTTTNLPVNSDKVTIAFWMKTTQTTLGIIAELSPDVTSNNSFAVFINGPEQINKIQAWNKNQGHNNVTNPTTINDGIWRHFVVVIDRSQNGVNEIEFYENGVLMTVTKENSTNNNGNFANDILYIGQRAGGTSGFKGMITLFKIYNHRLAPSEVLNLYNSEL